MSRSLFSVALLLLLAACKDKPSAPRPPPERLESDVRPAFDGAPRKLDARALALCEALHQLPAQRRAACCQGATPAHFGGECARVLSIALEQGTIELNHAEACVKDQAAAHQGCGWVGPNEVPLPESCAAVVVGHAAMGARCRSTLECVPGLRCQGSGPTSTGTCAPAGQDGMACELSVDVLAAYGRQALPAHSECSGFCQRHRCETVLTDGGSCTLDAQCPAGQRCAGNCVAGAHGAAGERCVPGGCAPGLRCVGGTCAAPRAEGLPCLQDLDCLGACVASRCAPGC